MTRRPQMLEQELLDGTLGADLLEFLNSTEFDIEEARALRTRLRKALLLADGEAIWEPPRAFAVGESSGAV